MSDATEEEVDAAERTRQAEAKKELETKQQHRKRAKQLKRVWSFANSNLVLWLLSAIVLSIVPLVLTQRAAEQQQHAQDEARRFLVGMELYERIAQVGGLNHPSDLGQLRLKLLGVLSDKKAHSRPEFEGVSTYAIYFEWCKLSGPKCPVSPLGLRNDGQNLLTLPVDQPLAPPMPEDYVAQTIAEIQLAFLSVSSEIADNKRGPGEMKLVAGPNNRLQIVPGAKAPESYLGGFQLGTDGDGRWNWDAGSGSGGVVVTCSPPMTAVLGPCATPGAIELPLAP